MNEVYDKVKKLLKTEIKTGLMDDDFIRGIITIAVTIRFKHLGWYWLMKMPDDIKSIDAEPHIKALEERAQDEVAYRVFRINDKRVRHGFESWI